MHACFPCRTMRSDNEVHEMAQTRNLAQTQHTNKKVYKQNPHRTSPRHEHRHITRFVCPPRVHSSQAHCVQTQVKRTHGPYSSPFHALSRYVGLCQVVCCGLHITMYPLCRCYHQHDRVEHSTLEVPFSRSCPSQEICEGVFQLKIVPEAL